MGASDFTKLRTALKDIGAEHEAPIEFFSEFRSQLARRAPKGTLRMIRLRSTWFYFDKRGAFLGYDYAGYGEEEHFVAPIQQEPSNMKE